MTVIEYCAALEAAKADGVKNRKALDKCVPLIVDAYGYASSLKKDVDLLKALIKEFSDLAAVYATKHETIFGKDGVTVSGNGVKSGLVRIGNDLYNLANGYEGFKRISGDDISQDFVKGLPEGWVKQRSEIDGTAIKRANVTIQELAEYDLYRPEKNVWTYKRAASFIPESCDTKQLQD